MERLNNPIAMRWPADMYADLERMAAANRWTVASTVRFIVERYLAEERREPGTGGGR